MFIKQLRVGPMQNFVYLIGDAETKECLVVDPAWDVTAIMNEIAAEGLILKGALVTHYHPDHCGGHLWGHDIEGAQELIARANVPVHCHKQEAEGIMKITGLSKNDLRLAEGGDVITIGNTPIRIIHTPGHTPGSQCFLVGNSLISGDTLFLTGCGRVDLPGGNPQQMFESLSSKLAKLPTDTILYPGHSYGGSTATMAQVAAAVPYLQAASFGDWQRLYGR